MVINKEEDLPLIPLCNLYADGDAGMGRPRSETNTK